VVELRAIVRALAARPPDGSSGAPVLATLVRLRGSGYRRPGARMLVRPDGGWAGFVSGGCLEADLAERARRVAGRGVPETVTYDTRAGEDDVWGLAMGCNGIVDVLLEPLPARDDAGHPGFLLERMRRRRPGVLVTVARSDGAGAPALASHAWIEPDGVPPSAWVGVTADAARAALHEGAARWIHVDEPSGGTWDAFVEPILPPVRLVVVGAGPDAPPLVRAAHDLGWDVVVSDPRPAFADRDRFEPGEDVAVLACEPAEIAKRIDVDERTAVVVMTHSFPRDRAAIEALLPTGAAYVGVLGPRRRTRDLLDRCAAEDGFLPDPAALQRLHAPVGLDLGATTPEEIALSILAEVRAVLSGRTGGPLRERAGPIYGPRDAP